MITIDDRTNAAKVGPEAALTQAFQTVRRTIPRIGDQQPRIGQPDFTYQRCTDTDWVNGFWSGQLWLGFDYTGKASFLEAARRQRPYFAGRLTRPHTLDHDIGFLYSLSVVADYKLTGDIQARELGLKAADLLAERYNPLGRYIQAWNPIPGRNPSPQSSKPERGRMIVDCLENLGLLYWVAEQTGQTSYRDIAVSHALTAKRLLVREDGSTYHTFFFNHPTGEPLGGKTAQGYADESCWSRGQAWAIHGFALSYAYTGVPELLEAARKVADYVLAELVDAEDAVPLWDYRLPPDAPRYRDSSAGAITAAGLFLLADQLELSANNDVAGAKTYRQTARRILDSLINNYTTTDIPYAEGLLVHGASHVAMGLADNMLPYGDYFYLEALLRSLGKKDFFW